MMRRTFTFQAGGTPSSEGGPGSADGDHHVPIGGRYLFDPGSAFDGLGPLRITGARLYLKGGGVRMVDPASIRRMQMHVPLPLTGWRDRLEQAAAGMYLALTFVPGPFHRLGAWYLDALRRRLQALERRTWRPVDITRITEAWSEGSDWETSNATAWPKPDQDGPAGAGITLTYGPDDGAGTAEAILREAADMGPMGQEGNDR